MSKLMISYIFKTNLTNFRDAIINDDTDKICRFLDVERDYLNKKIDNQGNTPLILAIEYASPFTVNLLLAQGAQPDQPNLITARTPLNLAASKHFDDYSSNEAKKMLEKAKILLENGAYVDKPAIRRYKNSSFHEYLCKETPLMASVKRQNLSMAKLLIAHKANINYAETQSNVQAVHYAVINGDEPMFDLLNNATQLNFSTLTIGDDNLIHWFCSVKENDDRISLLKKLIEKGCDVNAMNWYRQTPIFLAVKNNMVHTCQILLNANARLDRVDHEGLKVIDFAVAGSECFKLLYKKIVENPLNIQPTNNSPIDPNRLNFQPRQFQIRRRSSAQTKSSSTSTNTFTNTSQQLQIDQNPSIPSSPSPYVFPLERRDSEEMDTKYERIWEKFIHKRRIRREKQDLTLQKPGELDPVST